MDPYWLTEVIFATKNAKMPRCYRHITRRERGILISRPINQSIRPICKPTQSHAGPGHWHCSQQDNFQTQVWQSRFFIPSARAQSDLLTALILFSTWTLDWLSAGNLLLESKNNISSQNCCLLFSLSAIRVRESQGGGRVVQARRLLLIQYHSSPSTDLSIFQHQIHHNSHSPYLVFHLSLLTWLLAVWGQIYAKYKPITLTPENTVYRVDK